MGVRALWLADAARLTGYPVLEVAGWRTRGHGDFRLLEGVVLHHTADGPTGNYPSFGVVRYGRAGLRGPLANLGLARDGTILVFASGVAWHAGPSRWAGFTDLNDEFLGIEAESRGTVDDWTPAQRDAYPRLVAALLYFLRRPASRACGHLECAVPAGRKIDPAFWDLGALRRQVDWMLADPLARIPRFAQEDNMPTAREIADAILDTPIDREGDITEAQRERPTTLRAVLAWSDANLVHAPWTSPAAADLARRVGEVHRTLQFGVAGERTAGDLVAWLHAQFGRLGSAGDAGQVAEALLEAGIGRQVADALVARLGPDPDPEPEPEPEPETSAA
ncbi:N-acetylmuramoyl-L-alanine amidase [Pseudonocardia hispaniensis]|uniref:N-acetylmuramoyl-L-alanine amidase n=1 Tax=Pseudonocardia hispaniensis TaxID=904933 RepID=A0ABW1IXK6_9PSEU